MSDNPQGPGWWQASDGKWYAPEQAQQPSGPPAGAGAPPAWGAPSPGYAAPGGMGAPAGGGGYASWGERVCATLIDAALLLPFYIVYFVLVATGSGVLIAIGFLFILAAIAASFYFAYLTGVTGQSPGKRLMGIRVINEQSGQPIGGGMGILRSFIHIVDGFCMIGYLFPLWDPKRQTFTDKIQTTVSLAGVPKQSFGADLFKA